MPSDRLQNLGNILASRNRARAERLNSTFFSVDIFDPRHRTGDENRELLLTALGPDFKIDINDNWPASPLDRGTTAS